MARPPTLSTPLLTGLLAAVAASACCAGPLLLVLLGVGGAWVSRLAALEPWQPAFIAVALVSFGLAFRRLYREEAGCPPGATCSAPAVCRRQRAFFWVAGFAAAALMSFPLYAPIFY